MVDNQQTPEVQEKRSLYQMVFGRRSLLSILIGTKILADKNVTASIVAIALVVTLCYIVAVVGKYEYANALTNIVFVVIGYYFGSKREVSNDSENDADDPKPKVA
jgi:hypothetical protein